MSMRPMARRGESARARRRPTSAAVCPGEKKSAPLDFWQARLQCTRGAPFRGSWCTWGGRPPEIRDSTTPAHRHGHARNWRWESQTLEMRGQQESLKRLQHKGHPEHAWEPTTL